MRPPRGRRWWAASPATRPCAWFGACGDSTSPASISWRSRRSSTLPPRSPRSSPPTCSSSSSACWPSRAAELPECRGAASGSWPAEADRSPRRGSHAVRRSGMPCAWPILAGCGKTRHGMPGSGASWNKMRVTHLEEARMRGDDQQQPAMFSYISPEARVPQDHPLRAIRTLVDEVLAELSPRFETLYSRVGRPSIPPEKLLRAQLLQILYTVRSERQLMEQLDYNLLFRWFVGLNMDDPVWDPTVFTKNRQRLLDGEVATAFLERVVGQAQRRGLLSGEHFTVDGTLLEAWAGLKSFQRKDDTARPPDDPGNPTVDFHGERRSNETHASTTDPEARLARKGKGREAKLSYAGHAM